MSDVSDRDVSDSDLLCPACAVPIHVGDAFCEACGSTLDAARASGDATVESPTLSASGSTNHSAAQPAAQPAAQELGGRTHLLAPSAARVDVCHVCGAPNADDGFCSQCGQRARTRREHWTETPTAWVGGVCDKGIVHARNEDAMALAADGDDFAVLVVCDGVTTAPDSDRASLAASKAACAQLMAAARPTGSFAARLTAWQAALGAACATANAEAVAVARSLGDPQEPPSCTFVAAVVDHDLVAAAWCGDSRAYWIADDPAGSVELSLDHSLGTEMLAAGFTREQAESDPTFHTITRWLGADSIDPTPEFRTMAVDSPGWVLVVSDGMWNYASPADDLRRLIGDATADGATGPTQIAESLAAFANGCGGHDNITVALARRDPQLP